MSGRQGFRGKRVVVTGASSGIGEHLAIALARQGASLALSARRAELLRDVAARCETAGSPNVVVVAADVADRAACKRLIDASAAALGGIDVLVNNAGITMWARLDEITDLDLVEKIFRVNYFGAVHCTYYALDALKQSRGLVVAVSSLAGKTGVPTRSAYSASKHAMQGFFDSIRIELAPSGVDVCVISPGFVATPIREHAYGADGAPRGKSHRDETRGTMSVERCVELMMDAIAQRKRELVMTPRAKVGLWLKLVAPAVVDAMAARAARRED
jgi:short-subunit dehydrogenase